MRRPISHPAHPHLAPLVVSMAIHPQPSQWDAVPVQPSANRSSGSLDSEGDAHMCLWPPASMTQRRTLQRKIKQLANYTTQAY